MMPAKAPSASTLVQGACAGDGPSDHTLILRHDRWLADDDKKPPDVLRGAGPAPPPSAAGGGHVPAEHAPRGEGDVPGASPERERVARSTSATKYLIDPDYLQALLCCWSTYIARCATSFNHLSEQASTSAPAVQDPSLLRPIAALAVLLVREKVPRASGTVVHSVNRDG